MYNSTQYCKTFICTFHGLKGFDEQCVITAGAENVSHLFEHSPFHSVCCNVSGSF